MNAQDPIFRQVAMTLLGADELGELLGTAFVKECEKIGAEMSEIVFTDGVNALKGHVFLFFDRKLRFVENKWHFEGES